MKTVLIVDDDSKIRKLLQLNLKTLGYQVHVAADGAQGLRALDACEPDLVLLDVMMPGLDGFTVLAQLRSQSDVPVIMLTAKDQVEDKVRGLQLGADDYLAKPFALEELFGRMAAVLRRTQGGRGKTGLSHVAELSNGALHLDQSTYSAGVGETPLHLTKNEFGVLAVLMRHRLKVVPYEQVLREVWGPAYVDETHYVRVIVTRLRQKLNEAGVGGDVIRAISGVGYLMQALGESNRAR